MSGTSTSKASLSLQSIRDEIDSLAAQLYKNSQAVTETGRRMLNMESANSHRRVSGPASRFKDSADSDDEDEDGAGKSEVVGNEDLVQLVTELQDQLDLLDTRSIRRTANAFASDDSDFIAPLPGNDGFIPGESTPIATATGEDENDDESSLPQTPFPKTVKEFKALSRKDVEGWLRYYEVLPPREAELQAILTQAVGSRRQKETVAKTVPGPEETLLSEEEADTHFDTLARFFGLRIRKTAGAW